ncbi:MAG: ATP-binding protein, partial [Planctomycetota bacterium]|nr:ATP-binding protein [Planctomycetota bacterium]
VWVQVERDQVWVEIGDTGKGLSPEVRASLFEPYFTTRTQGTGLGLAIVRRVVEELGGTISLDDGPHGIGVLARLSLPRVEPT